MFFGIHGAIFNPLWLAAPLSLTAKVLWTIFIVTSEGGLLLPDNVVIYLRSK